MQQEEGTFQGAGGLNLYYQSWHPSGKVRGILGIVHGLGGYSGTFGRVVDYLIAKDYAVYGFDLRGHGRSPGQRAYINTWSEFREDLSAFLRLIEMHEPDCPRFLLGHSLGGVIVLDYVLRSAKGLLGERPQKKLQGVIVTAPALGRVGVPAWRLTLGWILSWLWPRFSLDTGINLAVVSREPEILEAYEKDPLMHSKGTARLATEFFTTLAWIRDRIADLQVPILILQGGADRVTFPESTRHFFEQITFPDKELREYSESYHEIYNDLDYQQMLIDLGNWLERHLQGEATQSSSAQI
ncbi:alpha/beta hydrolase [Pleurocapsales cyanobacterium LEGE 06147]|nr:alpha/beta hydrolase [Pleurocapsales cyanobacterium LEGE 06147]